MARRNELRAELVRPVNQPAELKILVAHNARVRRASSFVLLCEVLNDLSLELLRFINEIIRNAELVTHGAGVRNGLRSAAFVFRARDAVLRPEFERDADHIVTLFEQQRWGSGGIHSTTHAHNYACF